MKKLAILLIGVTLALVSCKKDLDQPDIKHFPDSNVWTIAQLLDTLAFNNGTYTFDQDYHKNATVKGYVIADEHSGGNVYSTLYLRGSDGCCISLTRNTGNNGTSEHFTESYGDYIGCKLYNTVLSTGKYNNPEVHIYEKDPNDVIVIYEKGCYDRVQPISATIPEINDGLYHLNLVKLSGVQFPQYTNLIYAYPDSYYTPWPIVDCDENSVVVNTSRSANFASDPLPSGKGTMVCIVTRYNDVKQLVIRNTSDVNMNGPRCDGTGGEPQDMPYVQDFATSFGTYITYSVMGNQMWTIYQNTAKMSGFSGQSHANEDWLISSPVHVTGVEHAKAVVNYVAQYPSPSEDDVTMQVSADYEFGTDPSTATWTELSVRYPNTSSFNDFQDVEASLDAFIGQTVTVAIKFKSTDSASRTIEISSITIQEGEASGGGGGGDLQTMPYTQDFSTAFGTYTTKNVIGDQAWNISYQSAVMTGHVKVGNEHHYYENEDWLLSSPVMIANVEHAKMVMNYAAKYDGPDNDITIQVSSDYTFGNMPESATWTALPVNIENQPGTEWTFTDMEVSLDAFIGQTVTVAIKFTSTNQASRTIEVKSITIQEGEAGGVTPPTPGTIFSETFASGMGGFTIQNVVLPSALTYIWAHDGSHSCVKANAYANNTDYESESWLISPAIDMSGHNNATLTFEHTANYLKSGTPADFYSVWVSTDYQDGLPETATWTELNVANYPAGNNWTFVNSGNIDMSSYVSNTNVHIAFKYTSFTGNAGCWEVQNVLVKE